MGVDCIAGMQAVQKLMWNLWKGQFKVILKSVKFVEAKKYQTLWLQSMSP